ncbi:MULTISPECIES: NAD-dependent succinate-semialdehyde dehydrogenase [unclassified Lentimicrobium]|uniref:NAD-dependent succinate-semialdehyde dehydrogenase n=1 Tax=unclassified Lentimicrobium TaxID=2677434 RepID=UPI001553DAD9|nr:MULTISPECIES: NAD-dependent succinate-semialdehyde dehydrogenase [unclassified Lentimicrobium]NPD46678.1 NAD-dependent succinate-semialdehyde dehydrogenase [Lentimicrobium sp. S6]NPD85503.1 NAD-dependent succinate-semialdehyde dehydrogenase [Lentimicrobium sp. L6]
MKSINPCNGTLIKEYQELSTDQVRQHIDKVQKAWISWKKTTFEERSKLMLALAQELRKNQEEYASIISLEMGKPIMESLGEVGKSAWVCEYYANEAEQMLKDEILESDTKESFVSFEPMGVILAVMPWNFPFWQVFRFAAPALMAGNVGLLKHASNVMGCAEAIESCFIKAGFPENTFKNLAIGSSKVEAIIKNPHIKATTLTGSEYAGSKVAGTSGSELKKSVLELGGSDPFIVLEDANLEEAAYWGVFSRLLNNGQSCIAAKRFILHEVIADQFLDLIQKEIKNWKIGNPMEKDCKLGPLARPDLLIDLEIQLKDAVDKGAEIIEGGKAISGPGNYFEPTIIKNLTPQMNIYHEETFGPVFSIYIIKNEEEAIIIANESAFGLGASLWTNDKERGVKLARRVESGAVFVNGMTKSDPRLPFGGIKKSGFGRELSHYGIKEFLNIKTIWVG